MFIVPLLPTYCATCIIEHCGYINLQVADISRSKAIVAFTSTGGTALRMAKLRPKVPILAVCDDIRVARWMSLVWGVHPILKQPHVGEFNINAEIDAVCKTIQDKGFVDDPETDLLTVTAGLPWGARGTTNVIRVTSATGTGYWFDRQGQLRKYEEQLPDMH
jgi:pyruvate kinase